MTRRDDLATLPEAERVAPLPEETLARARRTVAAHATSAEDRRMLLDMLGLSSNPAEAQPDPAGPPGPPQRRPAPAARVCACGKPATAGDRCGVHAGIVPSDQVRTVVERIRRHTGHSVREVAASTGIAYPTLKAALGPRSRGVRDSTYAALTRYAGEVGA